MLDIGWSELFVIGVVALVVVGPDDLPSMFRTMGRFTAKARKMGREFQRAMESAADEAGVKDVAKDLKSMTSAKSLGLNAVQEAARKFESWEPMKPLVKPAASALGGANPTIAAPGAIAAALPMGPATAALAAERAAAKAALDQQTAKAVSDAAGSVASPEPVQAPVVAANPVRKPASPKAAKPAAIPDAVFVPVSIPAAKPKATRTKATAKPADGTVKAASVKAASVKTAATAKPRAKSKSDTAPKTAPETGPETAPKSGAALAAKPARAAKKSDA